MNPSALATALGAAPDPAAAFDALHAYSDAHHPVRLWTVMIVDLEAGLARRAWSSQPQSYPPSGTKPIRYDDWFDIVHGQHEPFVANRIGQIAAVFGDHELIASLGCESCLNLPVVVNGTLAATVNMLDVAGHFTPDRVAQIRETIALPALAATLTARCAA